jgi:uncharacterized protein (DUF58 family)
LQVIPTPFYQQLYPGRYFFWAGACVALFFLMSWLVDFSIYLPASFAFLFIGIVVIDFYFLFWPSFQLSGVRQLPPRLSNHEENTVSIQLRHTYPLTMRVELMEELPEELQERTNKAKLFLAPRKLHTIHYVLKPFERGLYHFGYVNCLVQSPLGLVMRRLQKAQPTEVKVYPAFRNLRKFQLKAAAAWLNESGEGKLRKTGHSLEFDHIKEYVRGDDIRGINWKATARRATLMTNHFTEEKSRQVYALIDKGRLMKMPFDQLSLLDYAINATMMLGAVVWHKQDRFGVLSFAEKGGDFLLAARNAAQPAKLQELLYNIRTDFLESDFEQLYMQVRKNIQQRSLLLLFTNFESASGMRRQLPYLKLLSRHHLLLVILFENAELAEQALQPASNLEEVYTNTIAARFVNEKKKMAKELQASGIGCLLSRPQQLTVNVINKYTELKLRQAN